MKEKEDEIIDNIESLDNVKKIRKLIDEIKNNKEYNLLIEDFNKNKDLYEKKGILKEKVLELRNKIYSIKEIKEYMKLSTDIRLLSISISKIISSVIDESNCL
jgi:glutamine synthetase type III